MSGPVPDGPTHDWTRAVDREHLAAIRRDPDRYAPGGTLHLVLEVLGYAAEEASARGAGRCTVTLQPDGSIEVADDGRGRQTAIEDGRAVRKPVMSTADLRFFDAVDGPVLPDGRPRRGISVVAALSRWLVHTNRRVEGGWRQRYEHGLPVTGLVAVEPDGGTGTTVHFLPDLGQALLPPAGAAEWRLLHGFAPLVVALDDRRPG